MPEVPPQRHQETPTLVLEFELELLVSQVMDSGIPATVIGGPVVGFAGLGFESSRTHASEKSRRGVEDPVPRSDKRRASTMFQPLQTKVSRTMRVAESEDE